MKITKRSWIVLALGITSFMAAFGVALAALTIVQLSREVPGAR